MRLQAEGDTGSVYRNPRLAVAANHVSWRSATTPPRCGTTMLGIDAATVGFGVNK